jgi:hypothetical protein
MLATEPLTSVRLGGLDLPDRRRLRKRHARRQVKHARFRASP